MKFLFSVTALLVLSGCAATQNVAATSEALYSLEGKSLTLVQRESPSFVAMTSGKGMFAVAGVGAAAAEGNRMVEENGITDPSMTISRQVSETLIKNYGARFGGETPLVKSNDVEELVRHASDSDYALDIVTNGWTYIYDGFNFGDYYVGYSSKLRLVDVSSGEVVSRGFCNYDAKKNGKAAVSHEKLLADNAAYIKQELVDAANQCVEEFSAELFMVSPEALASRDL